MYWLATAAPIIVALTLLLAFRSAVIGLTGAVITAAISLHGSNLVTVCKSTMVDHAIPSLTGAWHLGPILFTLLLGSFAALLEKSGGFSTLINKIAGSSNHRTKPTLLATFAMGLVCFFDGLANAMLIGRVARPITDSICVSRQMLAYIIDSTSSAVACIAFISTWIASQLSYIQSGLDQAPPHLSQLSPLELYFHSIPANPYCWLALAMVLFVILFRFHIGPMKHYASKIEETEPLPPQEGRITSVILPIFILILSVPACIYLFQEGENWSWKNAFSGAYVPHAMVLAGIIALVAANAFFPKERWDKRGEIMKDGASSMLPALLILWLAWTLGSQLKELKLAQLISTHIAADVSITWFPLCVFISASLVSFSTGSSWGTMALFMTTALPVAIGLLQPDSDPTLSLSYVIGAVFGGAVFGDHCSPFSDTTVVSSLSAGCSMTSHVATQLPYAILAALFSTAAYCLIALGISAWLSTLTTITALGISIASYTKLRSS